MITTLDVETSFQIVEGKVDPLPFNPHNFLVVLGFLTSNEYDDPSFLGTSSPDALSYIPIQISYS